MSAPPYMKLYVADYLGDTHHLGALEHGAYLLLLMAMWRAGGALPAVDANLAKLARCTPDQWSEVSESVLPFFKRSRGRLTHKRLGEEMAKYETISRKRSEAVEAREAKKTNKTNVPDASNDPRLMTYPEPEPEPEPVVRDIGGGGERERASQTTDWPEGDGHHLAKLLAEAAGSPWLDPTKSPGLTTTLGRLLAWKRDGASWALDVLPVVTGLGTFQREPISTWTFFDKAIARSIATNRAALEIPEASAVVPFRPAKNREDQNRDGWDYAIARIAADE